MPDSAETSDEFGSSLAAGDFDSDDVDDLAVGVHFEDIGHIVNAGQVHVLYGSPQNGLSTAGNQVWHQDIVNIAGTNDDNDEIGAAMD